MYEVQKAKREIRKMAKDSKIAMKNKISELKDSIKIAKNDLRQLFKEMNAEYKQAKTAA